MKDATRCPHPRRQPNHLSDGRAPIGEVHFYAPTDWLDILENPHDEEAVRTRFRELTDLAFPTTRRGRGRRSPTGS